MQLKEVVPETSLLCKIDRETMLEKALISAFQDNKSIRVLDLCKETSVPETREYLLSRIMNWPTVHCPVSFSFVPPRSRSEPLSERKACDGVKCTVPSKPKDSWNARRKKRRSQKDVPREYLLADSSHSLLALFEYVTPIILGSYEVGTGSPGCNASNSTFPVDYSICIQDSARREWFKSRSRFVATILVLMGYLYTQPLPTVSDKHLSIAESMLKFLRGASNSSSLETTGKKVPTKTEGFSFFQESDDGQPGRRRVQKGKGILEMIEESARFDHQRLFNPQRCSRRDSFLSSCPFAKHLLMLLQPCFYKFQDYTKQTKQRQVIGNGSQGEFPFRKRLDEVLQEIFVVAGFVLDY